MSTYQEVKPTLSDNHDIYEFLNWVVVI